MKNLPKGMIPDRDNKVYYDTEKELFYIINWSDGGTHDIPERFYIGIEKQNTVKSIVVENDKIVNFPDVTRVEVIDQKGRNYVNWKVDNNVDISLQDNGRTLKIFINDK